MQYGKHTSGNMENIRPAPVLVLSFVRISLEFLFHFFSSSSCERVIGVLDAENVCSATTATAQRVRTAALVYGFAVVDARARCSV